MTDILNDLSRDADTYVIEAGKALIGYEPIDSYEAIFEESDESKAKEEANIKSAEKSKNFIVKAFEAIVKFLKELGERVREFIARLTMDANEREGLKQLEELINQNPELRGKKITVKDYRKFIAMHDEYLKEVDDAIRDVRKNEKTSIDRVVEKTKKFLAGNAAGLGVSMTCDVALKYCQGNLGAARALDTAIKNGIVDTEAIGKAIGAENANDFANKVGKYSKESTLRNLKNRILRRKALTLKEACNASVKSMRTAAFGLGFLGKSWKANEYVNQTRKAAVKGAISGAKEGVAKGIDKTREKNERRGRADAVHDYLDRKRKKKS